MLLARHFHAISAAEAALSHGRWLYIALFWWLLVRLAVSWLWRAKPIHPKAIEAWMDRVRVAALIPSYNEHPDAVIATIRSLARQTRRPDVVFVIDDGSAIRDGISDLLWRASFSDMEVRVYPMARNAGKRFAQAVAWRDTAPGEFDLWLIIDSDTELAPRAVERMTQEFADSTINAATSLILPRNRGFLPLLQEIEYATSILVGRLTYNVIGTVPVISGGCSAVRDRVVRANLDEYLAGYWGLRTGDDRHLAIMANMTGRVVVCPGTRAYTDVPTKLRKLLRQRVRWARSMYLGSAWAITHARARRIAAVSGLQLLLTLSSYAMVCGGMRSTSWSCRGYAATATCASRTPSRHDSSRHGCSRLCRQSFRWWC